MNRALFAEALGTALLLIAVVGSGIMGEMLSDGNAAIALLANAIATGCGLYVLITVLGPISGAHFNPAVTLAFYLRGEITAPRSIAYALVQIAGGIAGVFLTHLMFELPVVQLSTTVRSGASQYLSEAIATFGLLMVILGGLSARPTTVPGLVALYITGAYWFTSSTSFANPAVTIARGFSDTFAGIDPSGVPIFVIIQLATSAGSAYLLAWLFSPKT